MTENSVIIKTEETAGYIDHQPTDNTNNNTIVNNPNSFKNVKTFAENNNGVETNYSLTFRSNTLDKINEMKNEINTVNYNTKSKNSKKNLNIKIEEENSQRDDINAKINTIYQELNYKDIQMNTINAASTNYTRRDEKKEEIFYKTKHLNEFKINIMVQNQNNEEVVKILDYNELVSKNGHLIKIIHNPRNLISNKIKSYMENLLQNKILEKKQKVQPTVTTSKLTQKAPNGITYFSPKVTKVSKVGSQLESLLSNKNTESRVNFSKFNNSIIEQKKENIMNILSYKENSNKLKNGGGLKNNKLLTSSFRSGRSRESDEFASKINSPKTYNYNANDNIMNKIKTLMPEFKTEKSGKSNKYKYQMNMNMTDMDYQQNKVKILDGQFNRMFKKV